MTLCIKQVLYFTTRLKFSELDISILIFVDYYKERCQGLSISYFSKIRNLITKYLEFIVNKAMYILDRKNSKYIAVRARGYNIKAGCDLNTTKGLKEGVKRKWNSYRYNQIRDMSGSTCF